MMRLGQCKSTSFFFFFCFFYVNALFYREVCMYITVNGACTEENRSLLEGASELKTINNSRFIFESNLCEVFSTSV